MPEEATQSEAFIEQQPQFSPRQKAVLRAQFEELRNTKVRLAEAVLRQRELESLAEAQEKQFRATCRSALEGAGVDLQSEQSYTIKFPGIEILRVS